jgi:UDP-glucose 4-epimerase
MVEPILVVGAGGFVGKHLVRAFAERGTPVIAVTRRPVDFNSPDVEVIYGELNEPEQFLPLVARASAVLHLASCSTPGSTAGHPLVELNSNLRPTLSLLESMQKLPHKPLLYLSSGGSLYTSETAHPARETSIVRPLSYHGAGKIAAEYFISAWCLQFGGAATVLRPSNIYGPGQLERAGFGVIPTALRKIKNREVLSIWGDGSARRDYLYIDDFVALCIAICSRNTPPGSRVINVASGIDTSLNELFDAMEAVAGRQLLREYSPNRIIDAKQISMDISVANREYDWNPGISLREGLKRTWEWLITTPQ